MISTQTTTEQRVLAIVIDVTGIPPDSDPNANLHMELGVASATALHLLLELEQQLGVKIEDEKFVEATSINKLIAMLQGPAS